MKKFQCRKVWNEWENIILYFVEGNGNFLSIRGFGETVLIKSVINRKKACFSIKRVETENYFFFPIMYLQLHTHKKKYHEMNYS